MSAPRKVQLPVPAASSHLHAPGPPSHRFPATGTFPTPVGSPGIELPMHATPLAQSDCFVHARLLLSLHIPQKHFWWPGFGPPQSGLSLVIDTVVPELENVPPNGVGAPTPALRSGEQSML